MSRRYFESLRPGDFSAIDAVPGALFLVRIEHAQYCWHAQKSFYAVVFSVIEPKLLKGYKLSGRVYCTPKALWIMTPNSSAEAKSMIGRWSDLRAS